MHRFPIGTQYSIGTPRDPRTATVVDHLTTTNSHGLVVREAYVTQHRFCGQLVTEADVCDTSIARHLLPEYQHLLSKVRT
jgi:hypothetical protein